MSIWSRVVNVVRVDRVAREIDEELEAHIEAAIEEGRDPAEARRALGSALRHREASLDVRVATWLQSLCADAVVALRQLRRYPMTSAAAVVSLGLAMGACMAAFRLMDAALWRPLPIAHPERLYEILCKEVGPDDRCPNALFWQMRAAVRGPATILAIMEASPIEVTYGSDEETERVYQQFVSGEIFASFGLHPALGRLLTANDDLKPGVPRYTVLSYDYWSRRFGRDPNVIGRTYRIGARVSEIVGVLDKGFTGVEPGATVDMFVPMMANDFLLSNPDWAWFRTFAALKPAVSVEPLRAQLEVELESYLPARYGRMNAEGRLQESRRGKRTLLLERAQAGASRVQRKYRLPLSAVGVLVTLVMLIACANLANLLTAQASARARERALRVALGAGRGRLVQLVLVEAGCLASLGTAVGAGFAWWAAPFVVRSISPPNNPVRLVLPIDWRVLGFGLALAFVVTIVFSLGPAARAWAVNPLIAVNERDKPERRRLMYALIALQVALCFVAVFVGGLFVTTFHRLVTRPIGFSAERILLVNAAAPPSETNPTAWDVVAERLLTLPGVERVALAGWPLLNGDPGGYRVSIDDGPLTLSTYQLNVSAGWLDVMRIPLIAGRDFRPNEPLPRVALVSQSFVRQFLSGDNSLGKSFYIGGGIHLQIVGVVGDVRYNDVRDPDSPVVYVPFDRTDLAASRSPSATFVVRTATTEPLALAPIIRKEVLRARPGFRVTNVRTQQDVNDSQTLRERLLACLALFFATVALALAGVGLYGLLTYSVLARQREIGIRLAIGASAWHVVRCVTARILAMVLVGGVVGLVLGRVAGSLIKTLLYEVKPTDASALALPVLATVVAAALAALAPVLRAVRIDPAVTLRTE